MIQSIKDVSKNKYYTMTSIINNNKDKHFFNQMDSLLVKRRFDDAYELSLCENLLHVSTYNLTSVNIIKIIKDFINFAKKTNFFEKRNLYEIVKLSTLPTDKLKLSFNISLYKELADIFNIVSCATKLISFDFLILKIADNFALKINNESIKTAFVQIRKNILKKIINNDYNEEKREKETTVLCWIDRILSAVINEEISPENFVTLTNKIFNLTDKTIYSLWKLLHSINYLLLQKEFSASNTLRKYKREIIKSINTLYNNVDFTPSEVTNLVVKTLAKRFLYKEDYYYLFDVLELTSQKCIENKIHCLKMCKYIIYHNSKQNIFCFRFIRKYFIEMLFRIIDIPYENIRIKEEEISILIALFHVDTYFCFNRYEIFSKIISVLKTINNGKTKLNNINFYRFCDALDYIMSENPDVKDYEIIKHLSCKEDDVLKLKKYFILTFQSSLNTPLFSDTETTKNVV